MLATFELFSERDPENFWDNYQAIKFFFLN